MYIAPIIDSGIGIGFYESLEQWIQDLKIIHPESVIVSDLTELDIARGREKVYRSYIKGRKVGVFGGIPNHGYICSLLVSKLILRKHRVR